MKWFCVSVSGWKDHYVSEELVDGLLADGLKRTESEGFSVPASTVTIDLPGMVNMKRGFRSFNLDGFVISIPVTDIEVFYSCLLTDNPRKFKGDKYCFKMHGWLTCVVLTPFQRNTLLAEMDAQMDEIRLQADQENEITRDAIDAINKNGIKVVSNKAPKSLAKVITFKKPSSKLN